MQKRREFAQLGTFFPWEKNMGELRGPKNRYQATAFFGDCQTISTHLYFVSPFVDYCIGVFRSKTPAMDCGILNKYSVTGLWYPGYPHEPLVTTNIGSLQKLGNYSPILLPILMGFPIGLGISQYAY